MNLVEEVTFFNKGGILEELDNLPEYSRMDFRGQMTRYLDKDIRLMTEREAITNPASNIEFIKLRPTSA